MPCRNMDSEINNAAIAPLYKINELVEKPKIVIGINSSEYLKAKFVSLVIFIAIIKNIDSNLLPGNDFSPY